MANQRPYLGPLDAGVMPPEPQPEQPQLAEATGGAKFAQRMDESRARQMQAGATLGSWQPPNNPLAYGHFEAQPRDLKSKRMSTEEMISRPTTVNPWAGEPVRMSNPFEAGAHPGPYPVALGPVDVNPKRSPRLVALKPGRFAWQAEPLPTVQTVGAFAQQQKPPGSNAIGGNPITGADIEGHRPTLEEYQALLAQQKLGPESGVWSGQDLLEYNLNKTPPKPISEAEIRKRKKANAASTKKQRAYDEATYPGLYASQERQRRDREEQLVDEEAQRSGVLGMDFTRQDIDKKAERLRVFHSLSPQMQQLYLAGLRREQLMKEAEALSNTRDIVNQAAVPLRSI